MPHICKALCTHHLIEDSRQPSDIGSIIILTLQMRKWSVRRVQLLKLHLRGFPVSSRASAPKVGE